MKLCTAGANAADKAIHNRCPTSLKGWSDFRYEHVAVTESRIPRAHFSPQALPCQIDTTVTPHRFQRHKCDFIKWTEPIELWGRRVDLSQMA